MKRLFAALIGLIALASPISAQNDVLILVDGGSWLNGQWSFIENGIISFLQANPQIRNYGFAIAGINRNFVHFTQTTPASSSHFDQIRGQVLSSNFIDNHSLLSWTISNLQRLGTYSTRNVILISSFGFPDDFIAAYRSGFEQFLAAAGGQNRVLSVWVKPSPSATLSRGALSFIQTFGNFQLSLNGVNEFRGATLSSAYANYVGGAPVTPAPATSAPATSGPGQNTPPPDINQPDHIDTGCIRYADIVFVLDSSSSMEFGDVNYWPMQKQFVNQVIDRFEVGPSYIRVGLVKFSNQAFEEFDLNTHSTKEAVKTAVSQSVYVRGRTFTGEGIQMARGLFTRHPRPGVDKIIVLITDGNPTGPWENEASQAKYNDGIIIASVGVGTTVNTTILYSIASRNDLVLFIERFEYLVDKVSETYTHILCRSRFCNTLDLTDLLFIVPITDEQSITNATNFVLDIVSVIKLNHQRTGVEGSRVSVILMSSTARVLFKLDDLISQAENPITLIRQRLNSVRIEPSSINNMRDALTLARDQVFVPNGDENKRRNLVVLLASSPSQQAGLDTIANSLRTSKQATILTVAINPGTSENGQLRQELSQIASSEPVDGGISLYFYSSAGLLQRRTFSLMSAACQVMEWTQITSDVETKGPKGLTGQQGPQGAAGLPGAPGGPGSNGGPGAPGDNGQPGPSGSPGLRGDSGDPGGPGNPGLPGANGNRGDRGENGRNGSPGPSGSPGPKGFRGVKGVAGPDGLPGSGIPGGPGAKGDRGNPGFPGNPGSPGNQGIPGNKGMKGNSGADGARGRDGLPGPNGSPGPKGQKGSRGRDGQPGIGLPGLQGATGFTGLSGSPGNPGFQGTPGAKGEPGQRGFNGSPGQKGQRGSNGRNGFDGAPGQSGDKGERGVSGSDQRGDKGERGFNGLPGSPGNPGSNGFPGSAGQKGIKGLPGNNGFPGSPGLPGAKGQSGFPGSKGIKGFPGRPGFGRPGLQGLPGQQGQPGSPGFRGSNGDQGAPGPNGMDGVKGMSGQPGNAGSPGSPGNKGVKGFRGADGRPGEPGVGQPGPRGDKGVTGVPGSPGSPGQNGFPGSPGRQGQKGLQGSPGLPGRDGAQGRPGSIGEVGPRGPQGIKGRAGSPGPGPAGDTGFPGNSGRDGPPGFAGNPGPQGQLGDTGLSGSPGRPGSPGGPGATGATGPRGPDGEQGGTGSPGERGTDGSPGSPGFRGQPGATGFPGSVGQVGQVGVQGDRGDTGFSQGGFPGNPGPDGPPGLPGPAGPSGSGYVDQCQRNNGGCHQLCVSTFFSHYCACHPGYTLRKIEMPFCADVARPGFNGAGIDIVVGGGDNTNPPTNADFPTADVAFLIDSSNFQAFSSVANFVNSLLNNLNLRFDRTRIALIYFDSQSTHFFDFNAFTDLRQLQDRIRSLQGSGRIPANLGGGLQYASRFMLDPQYGGRQNVPKVLVVFSIGNDRPDSTEARQAVAAMRDRVQIVTVGIGAANIEALRDVVATSPRWVVTATGLDRLDDNTIKVASVMREAADDQSTNPLDPPTPPAACANRIDLVLIVDSSGSTINQQNPKRQFEYIKMFLRDMVKNLGVSYSGVRVGIVLFSAFPDVRMRLDQTWDLEQVLGVIDKLPFMAGKTNIAGGLEAGRLLFDSSLGDRFDVSNLAVLITDGKANINEGAPMIREAQFLRDVATVMAIGITDHAYMADLQEIASQSGLVLHAEQYETLQAKLADVNRMSCRTTGYFPRADIAIVLDTSNNVDNLVAAMQAVRDLLNGFNIGPTSDVKIGVIIYGQGARIVQTLSSNVQNVIGTIPQLAQSQGSFEPNVEAALRVTAQEFFTEANGDRPEASNIAVFFTTGRVPTVTFMPTADRMMTNGIAVVAVGVNQGADINFLTQLASRPELAVVTNSYQNVLSNLEVIARASRTAVGLVFVPHWRPTIARNHLCYDTCRHGVQCFCWENKQSLNSSVCINIDECSQNNGGCSHLCVDTEGSYYCACPEGLTLGSDGRKCVDVNECDGNPCNSGGQCVNTMGGYACLYDRPRTGAQTAPLAIANANGVGTLVGATVGTAVGTVLIILIVAIVVSKLRQGQSEEGSSDGHVNAGFSGESNATLKASNRAFDDISMPDTTVSDGDSLSNFSVSNVM